MSAPASARIWFLGVEPFGRSRSHGSCRSCEGQTDATGTRPATPKSTDKVESHVDHQLHGVCDVRRFALRQPPGRSAIPARPQQGSSFLTSDTPGTCARAHLHLPACACTYLQLQPQKRSRRLQLLGAGRWQLQRCWLFPLFKLSAGPTPPSNPPILSCVPSQLPLTNCFVSIHRPSSFHHSPALHPPPVHHHHPVDQGNLDVGTMGMFTERDCTPELALA